MREIQRTIDTPVSLRDLPATFLDLVGNSGDTTLPGGSLRQLWDQSSASANPKPLSPAISEIVDREKTASRDWTTGASIVMDGFIYLRNVEGKESLYDLHKDPREKNNLIPLNTHSLQLDQLRDLVNSMVPSNPDLSNPNMSSNNDDEDD